MMARSLRPSLAILAVCAGSILLTGCALRSMFGNVIIVEDIEEEVNEIITTVYSDSTAAVCLDTDYGFYECTYIVEGEIITSTLYLVAEFGITGVLIDPVIMQIPDDVTEVTGTYDDGSGPQPLIITHTDTFRVTTGITVTAETGHRFAILELPASVTDGLPSGDPNLAPEFDYAVEFRRSQPIGAPIDPVTVKVMLTGKVTLNGHPFYIPILPCVTDFASIPALQIPQSDTPVDLEPAIGDLIGLGGDVVCDHEAYFFDYLPPPASKLFLPIVTR